jgi:predicted RND superfamily exporter protein
VTRRLEELRVLGEVRSVTSPTSLLPSRATQEQRLGRWRALPREQAAEDLRLALERAGFRPEAFAPALEVLAREPEPIDPTRADLPGLEMLLERHLKSDSSGLSILVAFTPADRAALERVAEKLAAEVEVPPGVRFAVTGRPLMERELYRVGKREIFWFLAAVAVGTVALIFLHERRVGSTLAILAIPAGSLLLTLGIAGAAGIAITPVNLVALPLIIGIGVDYCLYLVERMHEVRDGAEAVLLGGRALTIDAATTVVGFGVLAISRYPALRDLGLVAAIGLTICFLGTVLVLPAVLGPGTLRRVLPVRA